MYLPVIYYVWKQLCPPHTSLDTGCTCHFLQWCMDLMDIHSVNVDIIVLLQYGITIASTHMARLSFIYIPCKARHTHIFKQLQSNSRVPAGNICYHDRTSIFMATKVASPQNIIIIIVGSWSSATVGTCYQSITSLAGYARFDLLHIMKYYCMYLQCFMRPQTNPNGSRGKNNSYLTVQTI
jgi:hypothetical protein